MLSTSAPAKPSFAKVASKAVPQSGKSKMQFKDREKPDQIRISNIVAAKAVADAVRTSLGPKGMDKMILKSDKDVVISNDGATILKHMSVLHPVARMLVDLSAAQDVEAGDGTTTVVVLAGSLLGAAENLLKKGIHPTAIAEALMTTATNATEILESMGKSIEMNDTASLLQAAQTSLSSKVVSQYSSLLAPLAVEAVMALAPPGTTNVDLRDIRVVKKVGGTIEDTKLVPGLVLTQNVSKSANGPTRVEKAKIAMIQFQLSPPKPDMENQVIVNDYHQMDKILKEERAYLLDMVKRIKKTGCNVLLIQKSILRDAVTDLSLHFLSKVKIMVIKNMERDEVDFICKSTGCKPIADIESFTEDKLATAEVVEEINEDGARYVRIGNKIIGSAVTDAPKDIVPRSTSGSTLSGSASPKTVCIVVRGSNESTVSEAERSIHDALCVTRCLVKKPSLICGGGASEIELSVNLRKRALTQLSATAFCMAAFADAIETIPFTLAENAGLNPIRVVTELRNMHAEGYQNAGINVKRGTAVKDMWDPTETHTVVQPLLVSLSAIELASETVRMVLKIDDLVGTR